MHTITLKDGEFKARLQEYLRDRIRVPAIDLLCCVARLDQHEWTIEAQARLAKVMKEIDWLHQPGTDGPESYFYAAPGYADPMPGHKRFRQCIVCTGYFGRHPFSHDVTPCPCGECLSGDGFPSLTHETVQRHGQAMHRSQNGPSQAHDLPKATHSDPQAHSPLPTKCPAADADDPRTRRSECRHDQRSEKDRQSESPFVERDSIAHSCSISGKQSGERHQ